MKLGKKRPVDDSLLYGAVMFDEAKELVAKLLTEKDGEILADILDHVVNSSDLSHAVLFLLLAHARADMASAIDASALELASARPTFESLIIIGGNK